MVLFLLKITMTIPSTQKNKGAPKDALNVIREQLTRNLLTLDSPTTGIKCHQCNRDNHGTNVQFSPFIREDSPDNQSGET